MTRRSTSARNFAASASTSPRITPASRGLAEAIGEATALRLCDALYNTWQMIPSRVVIHRQVCELAAQGITKREIARQLKMREAQVYAVLKKARENV